MVVTLPFRVLCCEVDFKGFIKSPEQIAEADVIVAGLLAAAVLRHAHAFEPNPAIAHQHRQCKVQQSQNRLACARANPAFVHLPITRFDSEPLAVRFKHPTRLIDVHTIVSKRECLATVFAAFAVLILAVHADMKPRRYFLFVFDRCDGVSVKTAFLPRRILSRATGRRVVRRFFAANHYRHHANAECKEQSSEWLFPLSTLNSAL